MFNEMFYGMLGFMKLITYYVISLYKILGVSMLITIIYIYINLVHSYLCCAPLGLRIEAYNPNVKALPHGHL